MIQLGNRYRHPGSPSAPIVTPTKSPFVSANQRVTTPQERGHNSTPIHTPLASTCFASLALPLLPLASVTLSL